MVVKCFNRVSALKFLTEENPNFTLVHYNWTVGGDFYSLFLCITTQGPLASLSLLLRYYHWFAMVKLSVSFHLYCKGLICILFTVTVVLFLMTRLLSRIRLISSCVLLRQIFFESIFSRSQKNLFFCWNTKSRWKDFYNSWCNFSENKNCCFWKWLVSGNWLKYRLNLVWLHDCGQSLSRVTIAGGLSLVSDSRDRQFWKIEKVASNKFNNRPISLWIISQSRQWF